MDEETHHGPNKSRIRLRIFSYIILFLVLLALFVVWISRASLADDVIQSQLEAYDVEASYDIEEIGLSKQVIRNLVIGDPEKPDLTADLVEVGNSLTLSGVGINWIEANGVRLFGRLVDGRLSFGDLDKFTDPEDESPLALPDMWLGLSDTKMRIDSDYGAFGITLTGEGNLQDGFKGELAAVSKRVEIADCVSENPSYFGDIAIADKKPRLTGPLRLSAVNCPSMRMMAKDLAVQLALDLGADLASWSGNIGLNGGPIDFGDYSTQKIRSSIDFAGDMNQSGGDIELMVDGLESPYGAADSARMTGPFEWAYGGARMTGSFAGRPQIDNIRIADRLLQQATGLATAANDTPLGPIATKLSTAVRTAGRQLDLSGDIKFQNSEARTTLAISALDARSRSGAIVSLSNPILLTLTDANVRLLADGNLRLAGGGFPDARLILNDGSLSRGFAGRLEMPSYQAGRAQLRIPSLTFSPTRAGGTKIDGRMILNGPLADGQIAGLQIPLTGGLDRNGGLALFEQCIDVQFASLTTSTLSAGPTNVRLCPQGKAIVSSNDSGVRIAANAPSLDLTGAVGVTPLSISSGALSFSLVNGLNAENLSVQLGTVDSMTKLDMAVFSAAFGDMFSGKIIGASGQVASVPLLMEQIEGGWQYVDGALRVDAGLLVRDQEAVERFKPMVSNDVLLNFSNGEVKATGLLREPKSQTAIASIDILHILNNSVGRALIDVESLTFDDGLQPEELTPLVLGIIANVQGELSGRGRIDWDNSEDGVKSSGKFRTNGLNLAAAFGPVTGLAGEIEFSDLLALETVPDQIVKMAEVNPGVAVFNGQIAYQLLPDYKMQIKGGNWPFAGGRLSLEPTTLDLSEEAERRLVFTVEGVDAAQFLTQFDFENMTATGVFDGKLPMVFDQDGGRIVGGYLVAREGGGSLAYVGELTYEDMGTMANFAFNALKSINYRELTIGMDGDIAGEIITQVKFSGLQQGEDASRNFITKQLARLPIQFNVRIQAPFMQLMSSAKSYYEPEILVGQNLPALLRAQEARATEAVKVLKEDE